MILRTLLFNRKGNKIATINKVEYPNAVRFSPDRSVL